MRLLTAISIASLIVSIAAVVFVLGLYAELEKSEPETPKEHTQDLEKNAITLLLGDYIETGMKHDFYNMEGATYPPGKDCLYWEFGQAMEPNGDVRTQRKLNMVYRDEKLKAITIRYDSKTDLWFANVVSFGCQGVESWSISDNTGAINSLGSRSDK